MTRQAEFTMPSLGADMDEGTIVEWLVKPGDQVNKGDIVAVVDTAKAAVEVECFDEGVIDRLLVEPGRVVPVGTPLAVIAAGATTPAIAAATTSRAPGAVRPPTPLPASLPPEPPEPHVSSPIVRHLAAELGIDLAEVTATGRSGTVTRADVVRAAAAQGTAAENGEAPKPVARKAQAQKAAAPKPSRGRARPERPERREKPEEPPVPTEPPGRRSRVSPLARRLAGELGVDLAQVTGTGARGAIRADDVRLTAQHRIAEPAGPSPAGRSPAEPAAAPAQAPAAEPAAGRSQAERKDAMRQAIGRLMARSKREIPHYYLSSTIDMSAALAWMHERNRALPVPERLLPAALLLKATALAARTVPDLNGFWENEHFTPGEAVNLGVAVSLRGGGLVTPAVRDAAALPTIDLMARLKDLAVRGRTGRLRGSELTGATITVTNLGDQGVESVTGVIFPPQVALVGFGKVVERPWAVDGLLGVRPVVTVTLAADHRASDGYTGARFLDTVARLLQRPEELDS